MTTSKNVSWILSIFSDIRNFNFHFSPSCRLISALVSLLSVAIPTGSFDVNISCATALACWSANSLPAMSLCPGTQCTCILLPFSVIRLMCCLMSVIISILIVRIWLWKADTMAPYQSVNTWMSLCSTWLTSAMNSRLIWIPISSHVKLLLWGLTPFFSSTGATSYPSRYTTPPAPVGHLQAAILPVTLWHSHPESVSQPWTPLC